MGQPTTNFFAPEAVLRLFVGLAVTGVVSLVYYPACLATVAVWHSVLDSLNPVYVLRVVRTVGSDYGVVVVTWIVVWVGTLLLQMSASLLFGWVPLFGGIPARIIAFWGQFYVAHLLGYAIYRHTGELGWG